MTKLAPSLLAADLLRLFDEIELVNQYADILHLDVMDGHFVPNLALGVGLCKAACKASRVPAYAHLMVTNPACYVDVFGNMGCKAFVWHVEANVEHMEIISKVKGLGIQAGLAISPDTPPSTLLPYAGCIDLVTVMGVHPGFAGQTFIESTVDKVRQIRAFCDKMEVEVDGGVNAQNSQELVAAGADILVSGSNFFAAKDKAAFSQSIRNIRR